MSEKVLNAVLAQKQLHFRFLLSGVRSGFGPVVAFLLCLATTCADLQACVGKRVSSGRANSQRQKNGHEIDCEAAQLDPAVN
jgi:hypothetical protein